MPTDVPQTTPHTFTENLVAIVAIVLFFTVPLGVMVGSILWFGLWAMIVWGPLMLWMYVRMIRDQNRKTREAREALSKLPIEQQRRIMVDATFNLRPPA